MNRPRNQVEHELKARARIYVANIPQSGMSRKEVVSVFHKYGEIDNVSLQTRHVFVQFTEESSALKALAQNPPDYIMSKKLDVKPVRPFFYRNGELVKNDRAVNFDANDKRNENRNQPRDYDDFRQTKPLINPSVMNPNSPNDCEIVVTNSSLTEYSEFLEVNLKKLNMKVDLLFPKPEIPINRVLGTLAQRGTFYVLVVREENKLYRSVTVDILHGVPEEHRNMPYKDALTLIVHSFDAYMRGEKMAPIPGVSGIPISECGIPLGDKHPEGITTLLNLLQDQRDLTVLQYDMMLQYLKEKKEEHIKEEVGVVPSFNKPTTDLPILPAAAAIQNPQAAHLHKRILSILNHKPLSSTEVSQAEKDSTSILKEPKIQKALESLFQGGTLLRK
ncbi:nuclear receptor coactivator 5 [Adelges cooleyi]|uniref:nuclear receptor coactivator 5 n=1 Tax=Adelges cooleyi TaxID=133065 RepID=UPI00217F4117|nr:nuclear receptor coactivator 5 [Adelges cooleyi]XP_050431657.1 nuclear receptor coactivator 5 [Adelges cooleyi]